MLRKVILLKVLDSLEYYARTLGMLKEHREGIEFDFSESEKIIAFLGPQRNFKFCYDYRGGIIDIYEKSNYNVTPEYYKLNTQTLMP